MNPSVSTTHQFLHGKKMFIFYLQLTLATAVFGQNASYSANTIPIGGTYSTGFGTLTLHANTGVGNTATGYVALYSNTSGNYNTATGRSSLFYNTTGLYNTASGYQSLMANTTGSWNTASGYQALFSNSTGSNNTATGWKALYSNTTASSNTAYGYWALYANTTGYSNTATGLSAMYNNTTGDFNVANGHGALLTNTNGSLNTAIGYWALYYNSTGGGNTAVGTQALYTNTTGTHNTASGIMALYSNTTGINNTGSGHYALYTNTTGNNNTAYGYYADVSSAALSNATAIGYGAVSDASNKVRIGNTAVTSIGGQVGWTIFSDSRVKKNIREDVPGLAFISLLKPVTYNYNVAKENELLGRKVDAAELTANNDIEKIDFAGFLAQDVEAAAKKIGYNFSGIDKTGSIMGLRYSDFVVPMVKAIQELQQQNEELKKLIAAGATVYGSSMELSDKNAAALHQNAPNPFTKQTVIRFSIPQNAGSAQMLFYDATGRLISSHNIADRGRGLLTVAANDLSNGVYSYTLIVDGKLTDSKKLIKQ